jgi:hypothetical protein
VIEYAGYAECIKRICKYFILSANVNIYLIDLQIRLSLNHAGLAKARSGLLEILEDVQLRQQRHSLLEILENVQLR